MRNEPSGFSDAIAAIDADFNDTRLEQRRGRQSQPDAQVIPLFPKRRFDYTFLFEGTSRSVVIKRSISMVPFIYYWLMVRIHRVDILAGSFTLACFNTLPSPGEPQEFSIPTHNGLTITVNNTATAGQLYFDTSTFQGPYFKVVLTATQGFGATPIRLYAELSAVLYGRSAG